MVSQLVKRLCPLLCFALLIGCGKTINEPKTSRAGFQGQEQQLSSDLTLQIDETISSMKLFQLPKNAWFKLPTKLVVKNGNSIGKKIIIYYNLRGSRDYEFLCTYQSTTENTTMFFEKCESRDGFEIISNANELKDREFPMDKGSAIKLLVVNPTGTGSKIESRYVVNWK